MVGFLERSFSWELEHLENSWPYWSHCCPWTGIPLHCYTIWDMHLAHQFGQRSVPIPPWGWGSSHGIAVVSSQDSKRAEQALGGSCWTCTWESWAFQKSPSLAQTQTHCQGKRPLQVPTQGMPLIQWESLGRNSASKLSCSLALPLWEMNLYSEKLRLG